MSVIRMHLLYLLPPEDSENSGASSDKGKEFWR
jgi:hypothetical protein